MQHKIKEPNPLNFYGLRRMKMPPKHFDFITVAMRYNLEESINNWIEENLKGRYYISKTVSINENRQIGPMVKIGFEEPKELSYFVLACPHLKYK